MFILLSGLQFDQGAYYKSEVNDSVEECGNVDSSDKT